MNKLGQVAFVSLMVGVVCFVLGLALSPAVKDIITSSTVMGVDGMNCDAVDITNQDKAICTSLDFFVPLFTSVIFGISGMLLGGLAVR